MVMIKDVIRYLNTAKVKVSFKNYDIYMDSRLRQAANTYSSMSGETLKILKIL